MELRQSTCDRADQCERHQDCVHFQRDDGRGQEHFDGRAVSGAVQFQHPALLPEQARRRAHLQQLQVRAHVAHRTQKHLKRLRIWCKNVCTDQALANGNLFSIQLLMLGRLGSELARRRGCNIRGIARNAFCFLTNPCLLPQVLQLRQAGRRLHQWHLLLRRCVGGAAVPNSSRPLGFVDGRAVDLRSAHQRPQVRAIGLALLCFFVILFAVCTGDPRRP